MFSIQGRFELMCCVDPLKPPDLSAMWSQAWPHSVGEIPTECSTIRPGTSRGATPCSGVFASSALRKHRSQHTKPDRLCESGILVRRIIMDTSALAQSESNHYPRAAGPIHTICVLGVLGVLGVLWRDSCRSSEWGGESEPRALLCAHSFLLNGSCSFL